VEPSGQGDAAHITGPTLCGQVGGSVEQRYPDRSSTIPIGGWKATNQSDMSAACYARKCRESGIPFRPNGLFPPHDVLLATLSAVPDSYPVSKHLWCQHSQTWKLAVDSFVAGDQAAAERGVDLRCFYVGKAQQQQQRNNGMVRAALRFSDKATIGGSLLLSCHGGAIESVLDEATGTRDSLAMSCLPA
jgi:hypothetical protein